MDQTQASDARSVEARLLQIRGDYGFDAPYVPIINIAIGVFLLLLGGVFALGFQNILAALPIIIAALLVFLFAGIYIYTTRVGKLHVWAELLARLGLRGDERLLDMGCGRGAVLLMAAKLLPRGKAVGVDIWQQRDQSGNDPAVTWANAAREGVAERIELETGDVRELPFPAASFDVIVSSVVIHNIPKSKHRLKAIDEAVRVLKPGGKLVITDIEATDSYAARLRELGFTAVEQRGLGWRFWYGNPWIAARLVQTTKPA